jgi:histidinol phosphatase-like enzyme (inositol monophosphatase family)
MIDVAIDAAKQAGALALKYFKNLPKVEYKPDNTPVTRADREAEQLIRKIIIKNFPDHGIIGEEFEAINPSAPLKWVIDPIDGTKDFVRSLPLWAIFIALLKNDKPILGIINYPASNEMFVASAGKGTYLNNKKTHVSKISKLKNSTITFGSPQRFKEKGFFQGFIKINEYPHHRRSLGPYGFNQLLKGNLDVQIEPGGSIWDFAAPAITVEEAGGKFTDFSGKYSLTSKSGVFTNGLLHNKTIKILNQK